VHRRVSAALHAVALRARTRGSGAASVSTTTSISSWNWRLSICPLSAGTSATSCTLPEGAAPWPGLPGEALQPALTRQGRRSDTSVPKGLSMGCILNRMDGPAPLGSNTLSS
jgi:hypothetical protein